MPVALALLLQAASIGAGAGPVPAAPSEVVVTGKRLREALEKCERGECSTRRDAQVSIASAEQLFRNGRYPDAQRLLAAAIARNRDKAASDPKPVAALYEASATVAAHHGDMRLYRRSTGHQTRTLRDHLPASDPAAAVGEFAAVDMWLQLGKAQQADASLEGIARRARDAGRLRLAAVATLRRASIYLGGDERSRVERLLREATSLSADADIARTARILRLRVATRHAADAEIDALVGGGGEVSGAKRTLIWSPPYSDAPDPEGSGWRPVNQFPGVATAEAPSQWADVGFWIRPDGRTADIEMLRGSRGMDRMAALTRQIAERRYSATADAGGGLGDYRIERWSWRSDLGTVTGNLARKRVGRAKLQVLDLTDGSTNVELAPG